MNIAVTDTLHPLYKAVLSRGADLGYTRPSYRGQLLQNEFVKDLVEANIWDFLDGLWIVAMKSGSREFALIDYKNPTGELCELNGAGSLTYTDETGLNGNGTGGYVDTKYSPQLAGVNFLQDSNSSFIGLTINSFSSAAYVDFGIQNTRCRALIAANTASYRCNTGVDTNAAIPGSTTLGLYHLQRRGATDQRLWKNGSNVSTNASASAIFPTGTFYYCGQNVGGTTFSNPSPCRVGLFGVGGALTGKEVALNTAWQNYFTNVQAL